MQVTFPSPDSQRLRRFMFDVKRVRIRTRRAFRLRVVLSVVPRARKSHRSEAVFVRYMTRRSSRPYRKVLRDSFRDDHLFQEFSVNNQRSSGHFLAQVSHISFRLRDKRTTTILIRRTSNQVTRVDHPMSQGFLTYVLPQGQMILLTNVNYIQTVHQFSRVTRVHPINCLFSRV